MIVGVELVKVFEGSLNSAEPVGEIAVLIILKGMSSAIVERGKRGYFGLKLKVGPERHQTPKGFCIIAI